MVFFTRLANLKVLKSMLMKILLVAGVLQTKKMQKMLFQELVSLFVMLTIQSFGAASFRPKLPFLQQRQSILPWLMLFVRQYQLKILCWRFNCIISMPNPMTDFCITVHEDNLLAIAIAESLKFTPHTKHIAIKYHHFHSRVKTSSNPTGDIKIKYISTKKQLADFFT
jgi:hypothetical protein